MTEFDCCTHFSVKPEYVNPAYADKGKQTFELDCSIFEKEQFAQKDKCMKVLAAKLEDSGRLPILLVDERHSLDLNEDNFLSEQELTQIRDSQKFDPHTRAIAAVTFNHFGEINTVRTSENHGGPNLLSRGEIRDYYELSASDLQSYARRRKFAF